MIEETENDDSVSDPLLIEGKLHRIPKDFVPDMEARPVSQSSAKEFDRSPIHFLNYLTAPRKPQSPGMFLGDVVDCLILTPDDFEAKFYTMPAIAPKKPGAAQIGAQYRNPDHKTYDAVKDKAILDALEWWDNFEKTNEGKRLIVPAIYERARRMEESVRDNERAIELLSRITRTQETIVFRDKGSGIKCIAKIDGRGDDLVMDLKSTNDAEETSYNRAAFDYGYHIQCGMYLKAFQAQYFRPTFKTDFYHLVVESSEPFAVDVRMANATYKSTGIGETNYILKQIEFCRDNDMWRMGYEFKHRFEKHGTLALPSYAYKLIERHK